METEEGLVRRARDGDRGAFEELVRRTTRLVYAKLYLETGDPVQAEDLVQETYLRAFRSVHRVTEPAGFRAWLLTIAQSAAIDAWRRGGKRRRETVVLQNEQVLEGTPAPQEEENGKREQLDKVRSILQSLPENYRLPLTLRYLDGQDYESITMQLGLSNGSLRGLLHRGLQLLKEGMKE